MGKNKNNYLSGIETINKMQNILRDLWRQKELRPFYNHDLDWINKKYIEARDAAIAFGEDVSNFPRRIKWRTNGSQIIKDI